MFFFCLKKTYTVIMEDVPEELKKTPRGHKILRHDSVVLDEI